MKCNQNCLKNAGNPRDMRRFQVRFSRSLFHLYAIRLKNVLLMSFEFAPIDPFRVLLSVYALSVSFV